VNGGPIDPLRKIAGFIAGTEDKTEIAAQLLSNFVEFKHDLKEFKSAVVDMSSNIKELNDSIVKLTETMK